MDELHLTGVPPTRQHRTTNSIMPFPRYPTSPRPENHAAQSKSGWPTSLHSSAPGIPSTWPFSWMCFTPHDPRWHLGRDLEQALPWPRSNAPWSWPPRRSTTPIKACSNAPHGLRRTLAKLNVTLQQWRRSASPRKRLRRTPHAHHQRREVNLPEYRDFAGRSPADHGFPRRVYNVKRITPALGYLTPVEFDGPVAKRSLGAYNN